VLKRILNIWTVPVALLFLCILAYGILSLTLGFYWDDWPMVWFSHTLGPQGYKEVFSSDRPFLAGVYILTSSLLQLIPWQWQLLGILCRWLSALTTWYTLRLLWPSQSEPTAWIAFLFAIYPGFKQQPISVVYSNGYLLFASYILSLGLCLKAIRNPERYWLWTFLGLASYIFSMFSTEYYIGLDLIRPVFIWLVLSETISKSRERMCKSFLYWLPYFLVLSGFMVWRVTIFKFPTYQPELVGAITQSPVFTGLKLFERIIQDIFTSGWRAWFEIFRFPKFSDFQLASEQLYWSVVFLTIPLVGLYLFFSRLGKERSSEPVSSRVSWSRQALWVGFLGLFFAGWPFWITDLPLTLSFPWDRFTLAFMLGSSIFLVGLVDWGLSGRLQKVIVLSLIIGMSVGTHLQNANTYRREWLSLGDFFWQLTWRAPSLKTGTLVITHTLPFTYYSDNSLTAPLNWTYAPNNHSTRIPYYLAFTQVRLGASIPDLKEGLTVRQSYRNAFFESSTSNALVIFYSPPGCLRVLHPTRDSSLPTLPTELEKALPISHLSQIQVDSNPPARPPEQIFGSEPAHTWCYFFEKADLARQKGDWHQVTVLGDQAAEAKLEPAELSEYLLFIDAYGHTGDWQKALRLVRKVYRRNPNLQSSLCSALDRQDTLNKALSSDPNASAGIQDMRTQMNCTTP